MTIDNDDENDEDSKKLTSSVPLEIHQDTIEDLDLVADIDLIVNAGSADEYKFDFNDDADLKAGHSQAVSQEAHGQSPHVDLTPQPDEIAATYTAFGQSALETGGTQFLVEEDLHFSQLGNDTQEQSWVAQPSLDRPQTPTEQQVANAKAPQGPLAQDQSEDVSVSSQNSLEYVVPNPLGEPKIADLLSPERVRQLETRNTPEPMQVDFLNDLIDDLPNVQKFQLTGQQQRPTMAAAAMPPLEEDHSSSDINTPPYNTAAARVGASNAASASQDDDRKPAARETVPPQGRAAEQTRATGNLAGDKGTEPIADGAHGSASQNQAAPRDSSQSVSAQQSASVAEIPTEIIVNNETSSDGTLELKRKHEVMAGHSSPTQAADKSTNLLQSDDDSAKMDEEEAHQMVRVSKRLKATKPHQQSSGTRQDDGQETRWIGLIESQGDQQSSASSTGEYHCPWPEAQDLDAIRSDEESLFGGRDTEDEGDSQSTTQKSASSESDGKLGSVLGHPDRGPRDDRNLNGMGR